MNFGGHLEKSGGQNPQNSKKQGGHGKPCNESQAKITESSLLKLMSPTLIC